MSERKVLNKYYPPDFDPSKIPRMKLPKNRQYTVRLMAPFNMRCATCGEYIYKGKKFNARKEDVENEDYLGIRIYRFYIKCTRCLQEISFKTDPRNTDYEIEAGATRNFMALKLAEEQALKEEEEAKEEEANNPMKLLENRTKQSKNEIELLESLEELKDLNKRQQVIDFDTMLSAYDSTLTQREREEKLRQLDEDYIKTVKFNSSQKRKVVVEEEVIEETESPTKLLKSDESWTSLAPSSSTSILTSTSTSNWSVSNNKLKNNVNKKTLVNLIKVKSTNDKKQTDENKKAEETVVVVSNKNDDKTEKSSVDNNSSKNSGVVGNGLSLLGAYSDSDSNSD